MLAVTRSLSRDYRDLKFKPFPEAEAEARTVAQLLGGDAVLRLGAEAREAELKSVQSPRVLDLATHGFFFPIRNSSRTNLVMPTCWLTARLAVLGATATRIGKIRWCVAASLCRRESRKANHECNCRGWRVDRLGSIATQFARNRSRHPKRVRFQLG